MNSVPMATDDLNNALNSTDTCPPVGPGPGPTIEVGKGTSKKSRASFGWALLEGGRGHKMEDMHVAEFQDLGGQEVGLFAIFDGHMGRHVPKFLRKHLFENIKGHPAFQNGDYLAAVREAYIDTDKDIVEREEAKNVRGGSAAVTGLLIDGQKLIVANLGDSRAVLGRGGKAEQLSVDHKPDTPEERKQIEEKGGAVVKFMGVWRVDAQLAMSRAFGDKDLKDHLSAEPYIREEDIGPSDSCLILASDGVWDVVTNEDSVSLAMEAGDAQKAAKAIVCEAYKRQSKDDISAVVVYFNQSS